MKGFLLDTNVISELIKSEPDGNVLRWIDDTDETILFLSVLTLGEIRNGIQRLEDDGGGEGGVGGAVDVIGAGRRGGG